MKKLFEISDDSGFIGIANLGKYESFIASDWDFDAIKDRIVREINRNHILFWSTGRERNWKVLVSTDDELKFKNPFRHEEA